VSTLGRVAGRGAVLRVSPHLQSIVVGEVVKLRERLSWFESRPLFWPGNRGDRSRTQSSSFLIPYRIGAAVMSCPTIEIVPRPALMTWTLLSGVCLITSGLIFTSVNGVEYFFARLQALGGDVRDLHGIKLCAIGPAKPGIDLPAICA